MKFCLSVNDFRVELSVKEYEQADGSYRPELTGKVYPFSDNIHFVDFVVSDHESDIGSSINTFNGSMGEKMVRARVIANEQVSHFKSLFAEMRGCKGDPRAVIDAMKKGDYAMAAIMLTMIPDVDEEILLTEVRQSLPQGSKATSVFTAILLDPCFTPALNLFGEGEVSVMGSEAMAAYNFAEYMGDIFTSLLPGGELSKNIDFYRHPKNVAEKMKMFISK